MGEWQNAAEPRNNTQAHSEISLTASHSAINYVSDEGFGEKIQDNLLAAKRSDEKASNRLIRSGSLA